MVETVLSITDNTLNSFDNSDSQCLLQPTLLLKDDQKSYSIRGINLEKSYHNKNLLNLFSSNSNTNVLNNLNINIEKGKIYGLLGPSGCGKTTLIKCLIGLIKFNKGTLIIDNDLKNSKFDQMVNLKKLGFMPQVVLKLNYGKLHCLTNEEIKSRQEFLIDLLNLPHKNSPVSSLSGGQLRRVSFAVSLINKPDLLMLDEPTVGMDPILRKKIWEYLEEISLKNQTTIVITTHYIEETRKADCLGFMRNGTIIEENSPQYFINKYKQNVLEDVFFKISSGDQAKEDDSSLKSKNTDKSNNNTFKSNKPQLEKFTSNISGYLKDKLNYMLNKFGFSFSRLNANLYKDTIKCKRNTKLLLVQLLIPIIQITFFCLCIGRTPRNLPIGIVNNDTETTVNLTAEIVKNLNNEIFFKKTYANLDTGYYELKNDKIFALITFDKGFSDGIINSVYDQTLPNSFKNKMHIYMEQNNNQIGYTIQDQIIESIKSVAFEYVNIYKNYNETDFPIVFEKSSYKKDKSSFTDYMAPGIALSVIFFLSVASTASNYVLERQLGLIERSHLAGVRIIELLLSQLIIYSLLMLIQIVIVLCLLYFFLNINFKLDSLPVLVGLIFSQGFCGLCYGLCLAALFYDQETVLQLTLASFYPILLMSGIIWPIEAQPVWLGNYISKMLPLTYATEAFRNLLEKGSDFNKEKIFYGYIETYSWILVFCLCFLFLFSFKKGK